MVTDVIMGTFVAVRMALTIVLGMSLGMMLGLAIGAFLFSLLLIPRNYHTALNISADSDPAIVAPTQGTPIANEMRKMLEFTESWTHWPDYQRVSTLNRILAILWPHITIAGLKMGLGIAKNSIAPMLEKIPWLEDITLGTKSMSNQPLYYPASEWVKGRAFGLGSTPLRLGGIKSYDTCDDEVVLEVPLLWGSEAKLDVGVHLKCCGMLRLFVPIEIANFQMKVETRITVKPLVETFPCVGGVTISLLQMPFVDMNLILFKGLDLFSLPFAKTALNWAMRLALGSLLLYPSSMSFPIMEQYGVPSVPKGALHVKLLRGENLPGEETFVRLKTRPQHYQYGATIRGQGNKPEYGQEFTLIVEDFEKQSLSLTVFQNKDDNDFKEPKLAVGKVPFGKHMQTGALDKAGQPRMTFDCAEFIRVPMKEMLIEVPLQKPANPMRSDAQKKKRKEDKERLGSFSMHMQKKHEKPRADAGKLYLKVTFMPFHQPEFDDEEENGQDLALLPTQRLVTHNVPNHLKGVLTVHIIRCINLKGEMPTTYVKLVLSQNASHHTPDQMQCTQMITGENNPRFGQKFDFVMIPADSELLISVYQKEGLRQATIFKKRKDAVIGALVLPVKDVARNGMLKDKWTLVDTERGQIELQLKWMTCYVNDG